MRTKLHWRMKHRKENQSLSLQNQKDLKAVIDKDEVQFIEFTAETRSSGIDHAMEHNIRKGAFDAIRNIVEKAGNTIPIETDERVKEIAANGGTPLVVS